jgi:hypothetical protein
MNKNWDTITFIITLGLVILISVFLLSQENIALAKEGLQQCISKNFIVIWVKECI